MRRNGPRQEQERQIQINIFGPYGCVGGFGLYDCEDHRSVGALRATQSSAEGTMAAAAERSLSERLARSYSTASAQGQEETKQRGHPMGRGAKLKAKWALRTPWALPTLSPPPAAVRRCPEPSLCPRFSSAPARQLPSSRGNRWVHPQLCFFLFLSRRSCSQCKEMGWDFSAPGSRGEEGEEPPLCCALVPPRVAALGQRREGEQQALPGTPCSRWARAEERCWRSSAQLCTA